MKSESEVQDISMDQIIPDPNQPRKDFSEVKQLVRSLKDLGQLQPIHVTKWEDNTFLILDGESRYSAAEILEWKTIKCIIIEINDEQRRDIQFAANYMRTDFNPFELADEYHRMMDDHDLSQVGLAEKLDKSESTISSILKLRELPDDIKNKLAPVSRKAGKEALILVSRADSKETMETLTNLIIAGASVAKLRKALKDNKKVTASEEEVTKATAAPADDPPQKLSDDPVPAISSEEETIIKVWWETFSIYAIRTSDLFAILPADIKMNLVALGKWIEERVGSIIEGNCIVTNSIAPGKIVHQLIPNQEYRRTSYEDELLVRSKENKAKTIKNK